MLGISNVDASSSLRTTRVERYGGVLDDETAEIVKTGDGGYVTAGTTYSFGADSSDYFLFKVDVNGNVE